MFFQRLPLNLQPMNDFQKYLLQELSVAVVDNHPLVLDGIRSLLLKKTDMKVECFSSASELLNNLDNSQQPYDIYIVDLDMGDRSVTEFVDDIRSVYPDARIITNTIRHDEWMVQQLMEHNVNAICSKQNFHTEIFPAITEVMKGKNYYSPEMKRNIGTFHHPRMETPSLREFDVLRAIAQGLTSKEIAEKLYISENTVEAHRKNLYTKFGARNIADLIVKAIARGYINPEEL